MHGTTLAWKMGEVSDFYLVDAKHTQDIVRGPDVIGSIRRGQVMTDCLFNDGSSYSDVDSFHTFPEYSQTWTVSTLFQNILGY